MRVTRYNFLFVIGLALMLGLSAVNANANDHKRPRNTGTLTVRTTPVSYPVKIDGQYAGMSGVGSSADFYLTPGIHTLEVAGPNGSILTREIEIRRDRKYCVCLKLVEETISRPCPYNFHLEGPDTVEEGQVAEFRAVNDGTAPIPIRYGWRVNNGRVTSGLGTPAITVDTTGMGEGLITASLDVNDDVYDNRCKQTIDVPTRITKIPPPPVIEERKPFRCDEFEARTPDDAKARFDNCVIQAQNTPDSQLYIVIYPGTDRLSTSRNSYDRMSKLALDYLVKTRGWDPRRISIVKGSTREKTTFEMWIVPPGATPPPIQ
jgi:hypothetical protein